MSSLADPGDFDPREGARLRDEALARLARRAALVRDLQRAAVRIALDRGTVTADDVRAAVPIPPPGNPKANGAALRDLSVRGILLAGEYIRTARPVAHRRPLVVWHLRDRAAAIAWLSANPPYPSPNL